MGPDLMADMRAQVEKFGAEIIQSHVTSVELCVAAVVVKHGRGRIHDARASSSPPARPRGFSDCRPSAR